MRIRMHRMTLVPFMFFAALGFCAQGIAEEFEVQTHYDKAEHRIAMRDGVELHTIVYSPKDTSRSYPILLLRTPYSVAPYGRDEFHTPLAIAPSKAFLRDGYIFALQDVRGRYKSEGEWEDFRPLRDDSRATDEATDTYDTIEWLIENVPGNNGRIGQWGISYDGWYTVKGMIEPHPALKAASPQATSGDFFIGDDFHHNGAFILMILDWIRHMNDSGAARGAQAEMKLPEFDYGTPWAYEFFLNAGPTDQLNEKYFDGRLDEQWTNLIGHPNYDAHWRLLNSLESLDNITVPVLNVSAWFDTFDPYGSMATYQEIEREDPQNRSTIVVGPWRHVGWLLYDGASLGDIQFGSKTSEYYKENIVFPFFQYYLKDKPGWSGTEAIMFETGGNAWHHLDHWPPKNVSMKNLYVRAGGKLSFEAPKADARSAHDTYVSDPWNPVPYSTEITILDSVTWRVEDQRLASTRPDVLVYETNLLEQDVTIAGPIGVELFVSTSGTDSDWFVKLIDVYPDDAPDGMGGYQMLVGVNVMRGRYRNTFSDPEPMEPGQMTPIRFEILDKFHTFKNGHKIMVQVQSSFFPYYDRNPQKFVNIYRATEEDYQKATQRVYRSAESPSHLILPVVE